MVSAMTTPAVTPQTPATPPNVFQQLSGGQQQTPAPATQSQGGNIFKQLAEGTYKDPNAATPEMSEQEKASKIMQMAVGGMTGMPQPVMNEQDRKEFEQGKIAGAVSVPAVAGLYLAAHSALAAGIPALTKALTTGAIGLGQWAAEHPTAAKIIYHSIGAAIEGTAIGVGSKIAGKVIRSSE